MDNCFSKGSVISAKVVDSFQFFHVGPLRMQGLLIDCDVLTDTPVLALIIQSEIGIKPFCFDLTMLPFSIYGPGLQIFDSIEGYMWYF